MDSKKLRSNPRDNPASLVVPDLDDIAEIGNARVDIPKQLEDRCKWRRIKENIAE
ncbi:hypothetical protein Goklo_013714 [Gossypium klotzschianum]|uniref:Uncharacterized protein n=1 Tax=Gossypium klotzschianum TaxID=34286 RepID=A0A7J8U586_9ROSI|nr:hypothetical protein [Gossypium klotzschianum]